MSCKPAANGPLRFGPRSSARGDITPEMLGIDPAGVEHVTRDLPMLRDLVLVDCPDPDTTEATPSCQGTVPIFAGTDAAMVGENGTVPFASAGSNLARLRKIVPHCDVLLVTATQQKYRSARVEEELSAAAAGARLVFVQTHADVGRRYSRRLARRVERSVCGRTYFLRRFAVRTGRRQARPPTARRIRRSGRSVVARTGRSGGQSHSPGEFPRSSGRNSCRMPQTAR